MAELDFDKVLHRQLLSGAQFNNLIPPYKNEDQFFEKKNEESDVFDTLKFMGQWSHKYAWQMQKVAPLLVGNSVQETVNNIYKWLYSHFQYKIDKVDDYQNLYSPAAAWHFRTTGFDCKSYSILASTILQCLSIPHSFRMVKQKGLRSANNPNQWIISPNDWSHVYVIVPDKNKYYVIDATTHDNREVQFVQKHDYAMKHRGLNGAYPQNMLGCACSGNKLGNTVSTTNNLAKAIANFHLFLDELEKQGVSRQTTSRILEIVKVNVQNGVDPNFKEVLQKSIAYQKGSLNGGIDLNTLSIGGVSAGTATAAAMGDPTALLSLANKVIPIDKMTSGFMSIFANGFNVTCYGSTYTPTQTKDWASTDFPKIYNQTLGKGLTQQNLDDFIDVMLHIKHKMDDNGHNMNSCSQKAMYNYGDAALAVLTTTLEKIKPYAKLTQVESVNVQGKTFPQYTFQMPDCYEPWTSPSTSWRFKLELIPPTVTKNPDGTITIKQSDGSIQIVSQTQYNNANIGGTSTAGGNTNNQPVGGTVIIGAVGHSNGTVTVKYSNGTEKTISADAYNKLIGNVTPPKKTDYTIPVLAAVGIGIKLAFF